MAAKQRGRCCFSPPPVSRYFSTWLPLTQQLFCSNTRLSLAKFRWHTGAQENRLSNWRESKIRSLFRLTGTWFLKGVGPAGIEPGKPSMCVCVCVAVAILLNMCYGAVERRPRSPSPPGKLLISEQNTERKEFAPAASWPSQSPSVLFPLILTM